jgi:hypothetical protein
MQNPNQILYAGNTYNIDDVIKGQSPFGMYDPLKQIAYQPAIRRNAAGMVASVLPYAETSLWGLFSQLQAHWGSDKKMVRARRFYHAEYESLGTYAFAVNKSNSSVPAGGVAVTVQVNRFALSSNGMFGKPLSGFTGYVKENGQQNIIITNVTELASGNFNITLQPINGEILNLTVRSTYTLVMNMLRSYDLSATNKIQTQGVVGEFPALYESWVQKYENGLEVDESELDNYVYTNDFTIQKGFDMNGKEVPYWDAPGLRMKAEEFITQNRLAKTLFNQRDYGNNREFDGLVPTIKKRGNFQFAYDQFVGASFKSLLFAMIKSIRKINGSSEYMLLHDFNFGIDWDNAIASLITANNQSYRFALFGDGGRGLQENFEYFQFKDFSWSNYKFRAYQMDIMDDRRFGRPLAYSAFLMPAKGHVDTDGNYCPPMTYVGIEGSEPAANQKVWVDDGRERGERTLTVYIKDNFGIEYNGASQWGMITKGGIGGDN